jgi:hypothetical protein
VRIAVPKETDFAATPEDSGAPAAGDGGVRLVNVSAAFVIQNLCVYKRAQEGGAES